MFEPKRITDAEGRAVERWVMMDWNLFGITCTCLPFLWWWAVVDLSDNVFSTVMALWLTVFAVWMLGGRHRALEVDDAGLRILHRTEVRWQVAWADLRSWQPEMCRRELLALRVTDRQGNEQRLPLGRYRPWGNWAQSVLESVAGHAAGVEAHEPVLVPMTRERLYTAVGVALLLLANMICQSWGMHHGH